MEIKEEGGATLELRRNPEDILLERIVLGMLGVLILLLATPAIVRIPSESVGPNPESIEIMRDESDTIVPYQDYLADPSEDLIFV